jgi:hypothetical protein
MRGPCGTGRGRGAGVLVEGWRMNCHQTKNALLAMKTPSETQKFRRMPPTWLEGSIRSTSS